MIDKYIVNSINIWHPFFITKGRKKHVSILKLVIKRGCGDRINMHTRK
jgi:hypothetical protein